ncbi:hypothetical protein [Weissella paramesenteroides]|uniref:hypothetical protein n=1 Tax=Weissella paramesenteroides TaxID=1249 RepID=UPI002E7B7F51|nr:hypothetical protein [Weissella paramesenteroides]WPQ68516.1 hypothetical protein QRX23_02700 [Weissella paramesenteroides]
MIDYEKLAQNHKKVSFTWYGREIQGTIVYYDDPEDEEDGPATLALENNDNSRFYVAYEIPTITDLKVLD